MTKTPKLSDLHLVLLSNAAARSDGMLLPPPGNLRTRGKTLEKALAKLLRLELVEECPATTPEEAWREDDDGRGAALRISAAGRAALGLEPAPHAETDEPAEAAGAIDEPEQANADDAAETEVTTEDATEDATAAAIFAPGVKPGTKQARLVDYLSRPWGMSIADLSRLLGWQPHYADARIMPR